MILVAKVFNEIDGIDFYGTFAPMVRLEVIKLILAFLCYKEFKLYIMNVKSEFLNEYITKHVFVE